MIQHSRKEVTPPEIFKMHELRLMRSDLLENLQNAKIITNLFAGNLNETRFLLQKLQELKNTAARFKAVDRSHPDNPHTVSDLNSTYGERVEFILADVFAHLETESPNSQDCVTAYGAEYVWANSTEVARKLCRLVALVLKPGGIAIIPALPHGAEQGSSLQQKFPGIFVKES